MSIRSVHVALMCSMFLTVSACGDDDNDSERDDGGMDAGRPDADGEQEDSGRDAPGSMDAEKVDTGAGGDPDADSGQQPDAGDGGVKDGGAEDTGEPRCGDGIPQEERGEECDDGNFFEDDGCTSLCEFECKDNEDCSDDNPCDGEEVCNAEHSCEERDNLEDGTSCGLRQHCFAGWCIEDLCGDELVNEDVLGEECDDGNGIDDDGCTGECKWTCESNSECEGGDPCAGTKTCNTDEHICLGDPLDDEAACVTEDVPDGWCVGGVCVPTNCGNGVIEGAEECDEGADNGKRASGCSKNCTIVVCGDGELQGAEQCDDSNTVDLDTCDGDCNAEVFVRWTKFNVMPGPAPDWCVHNRTNNENGGNALASAIAGMVEIPLGRTTSIEVDILKELINDEMMERVFDECEANPIAHISGVDDITFTRSDNDVELAGYSGELGPAERCSSPMRVDTGFSLLNEGLDENNRPSQVVPVIQRPGILRTEEPITIAPPEGAPEAGVGTLYDLMLLVPINTEKLSTPRDMADWVETPEEFGFDDDPSADYPAGIACAAMEASAIASLPVLATQEDFLAGGPCCKKDDNDEWQHYRACDLDAGDVPGVDCDSFLDVLRGGCTLCVNLDAPDPTIYEEYFTCLKCDRSFQVVRPTEMDVDTDGDGEPDAYSLVVGIEGKRIHSLGVKD